MFSCGQFPLWHGEAALSARASPIAFIEGVVTIGDFTGVTWGVGRFHNSICEQVVEGQPGSLIVLQSDPIWFAVQDLLECAVAQR